MGFFDLFKRKKDVECMELDREFYKENMNYSLKRQEMVTTLILSSALILFTVIVNFYNPNISDTLRTQISIGLVLFFLIWFGIYSYFDYSVKKSFRHYQRVSEKVSVEEKNRKEV